MMGFEGATHSLCQLKTKDIFGPSESDLNNRLEIKRVTWVLIAEIESHTGPFDDKTRIYKIEYCKMHRNHFV